MLSGDRRPVHENVTWETFEESTLGSNARGVSFPGWLFMVELRHPGSQFPNAPQPKAAHEKQKGPLGGAPPHSKVPQLY